MLATAVVQEGKPAMSRGDPSLTYLREGMVDLPAAKLTAEGGRALPTRVR